MENDTLIANVTNVAIASNRHDIEARAKAVNLVDCWLLGAINKINLKFHYTGVGVNVVHSFARHFAIHLHELIVVDEKCQRLYALKVSHGMLDGSKVSDRQRIGGVLQQLV